MCADGCGVWVDRQVGAGAIRPPLFLVPAAGEGFLLVRLRNWGLAVADFGPRGWGFLRDVIGGPKVVAFPGFVPFSLLVSSRAQLKRSVSAFGWRGMVENWGLLVCVVPRAPRSGVG